MAAAEARAAWQRTANRCLVQEDAKRAPKLACCPSSTPQNDSSCESTGNAQDHLVPSFMPLNRNTMNVNLSPETKWWLQMQPNFGYRKEFICEHLRSLEDEVHDDMETVVSTLELDDKSMPVASSDFVNKKEDFILESPWMVSTGFMKLGSETSVKEMNTSSYSQQHLKRKTAMDDCLCNEEVLLDLKPIDQLTSKRPEKDSPDFETPWTGGHKSEPWWRVSDKDELALLVAQKSLQHFENCDLPKPSQTVHVTTDTVSSHDKFNASGKFQSSLSRNAKITNANRFSHNSSTSWSSDKNFTSGEMGHMLRDSEKLYSHTQEYKKKEQPKDHKQTSANDLSRAELLEALRRSQTRARKAEMAAQKAYDEKEHIVKLLFRQASHLFAYKQWLQMLQLQNLFLQLKIKDHQLSTVLPWMPLKGKLSDKNKTSRKGRRHKCNICRYAVVFAVGLGLVGAGLLFGWTIGCLFPTV
ncbi:hypothetical protein Cni_G00056 [Canna indica]|uniref:Uncharacterized protein n=1 Tax=Canna indica TaxID=4628 RepID=A0AAQ3PVW8_9LILI|nr:hypothetical protein Cni_G00056 [Canna indica]